LAKAKRRMAAMRILFPHVPSVVPSLVSSILGLMVGGRPKYLQQTAMVMRDLWLNYRRRWHVKDPPLVWI